jgi:hypothetical protein
MCLGRPRAWRIAAAELAGILELGDQRHAIDAAELAGVDQGEHLERHGRRRGRARWHRPPTAHELAPVELKLRLYHRG